MTSVRFTLGRCMQLDLASLESVRDFAKAFEARHSRLD